MSVDSLSEDAEFLQAIDSSRGGRGGVEVTTLFILETRGRTPASAGTARGLLGVAAICIFRLIIPSEILVRSLPFNPGLDLSSEASTNALTACPLFGLRIKRIAESRSSCIEADFFRPGRADSGTERSISLLVNLLETTLFARLGGRSTCELLLGPPSVDPEDLRELRTDGSVELLARRGTRVLFCPSMPDVGSVPLLSDCLRVIGATVVAPFGP